MYEKYIFINILWKITSTTITKYSSWTQMFMICRQIEWNTKNTTLLDQNLKIIETCKIDTYDRSPSLFGTGISIKHGELKLVLWANIYFKWIHIAWRHIYSIALISVLLTEKHNTDQQVTDKPLSNEICIKCTSPRSEMRHYASIG